MHNIMTTCPTTGKDVATGILADINTLERLPDSISTAHCPHCGSTHSWSVRDAWLENEQQRSADHG
jgi:endogenous inhibitor of DNA gyrase (YacG/DUF329 family)